MYDRIAACDGRVEAPRCEQICFEKLKAISSPRKRYQMLRLCCGLKRPDGTVDLRKEFAFL